MRRVLVVPVLVLLMCLSALPASAAERTAVFQSDLSVPLLGTRAVGVLTVTYDDVTGAGSWSFDGSIDGQPASATGEGTMVVTGGTAGDDVGFELTMTAIETWEMPGFDPDVPRSAKVSSSDGVAYVDYDGPVFSLFAIPVAIDPPLTFPIEGIYVLTDPASGDEAVTEIPRTGIGPGDDAASLATVVTLPLMAVALVLLVLTVALGWAPGTWLNATVAGLRRTRRDVD